jgi:PIN domain nuclease of toxin-antitoxin system
MRLLIDTHVFLWFMTGDERLSRRARRAIEDIESELFLSVASVWEMAIKAGLGRLILPVPVAEYVAEKLDNGFRILPVEWTHASRDPFDRLLIAQSVAENIPIITADPIFRVYKANVVW